MRTDPTPEPGDLASPPFSNSDHGYSWLGNVCDGCIHDSTFGLPNENTMDADIDCPLITLSMTGTTPHDWLTDGELGTTCAAYETGDRAPVADPVVAVDLFGVYAAEPTLSPAAADGGTGTC